MPRVDFAQVMMDRAAEHRAVLERRARGEVVAPPFIPTGFRDWDRNGGIRRKCLSIIAGDTGEGKSHLKRHLARAAASAGYRTLVLDFEDAVEETADREFADDCGIPNQVLGVQGATREEVERMEAAVEDAAPWSLLVDYVPELMRADEMREELKRGCGLDGQMHDLVILDYAQAIPATPGQTLERTLAELAWDLNAHAKDHDAAVLIFSQVKTEVEERGAAYFERNQSAGYPACVAGYQPGPGKKDLSWCGAMGERCRDLGYVWRPGRWARAHGMKVPDNRMVIVKPKVNFGREGRIVLGCDLEHARLFDLDPSKEKDK